MKCPSEHLVQWRNYGPAGPAAAGGGGGRQKGAHFQA